MIYFIDLFCGAGGVTSGVLKATKNNKQIAQVIACINHDETAIASHKANHGEVLHFIEDIRTLDIAPIIQLVNQIRIIDGDSIICLWASLEYTNFSKAKVWMASFGSENCKIIANNDGLDLIDFQNWFSILPFKGQIICWSDKINY